MKLSVLDVLKLATQWHGSQKRRDGTPYISHPIRVALHAAQVMCQVDYSLVEDAMHVALLHDVLEDCPEVTVKVLEEGGVFGSVIGSCVVLNKTGHENYYNYLKAVLEDTVASVVKYCDICDNLDGLDPSEKNKRDKYLLAKHILLEELELEETE